MKLEKFIAVLRGHYSPEMEIVPIFWQAEDILWRAKDRDIILTDEDLGQIVDALTDNHDACIGINWDVIDFHIESLVALNQIAPLHSELTKGKRSGGGPIDE